MKSQEVENPPGNRNHPVLDSMMIPVLCATVIAVAFYLSIC